MTVRKLLPGHSKEISLLKQHIDLIEDNVDEAVLVLDGNARVIFCSRGIERILNLGLAQIKGAAVIDLVHPDDRARFDATYGSFKQLPERTHVRCRICFHTLASPPVVDVDNWLHMDLCLAPHHHPNLTVISLRSIQEFVAQAQSLDFTIGQLKNFRDSIEKSAIVLVLDQDLRLGFFNDTFLKALGVGHEHLVEINFHSLIQDEAVKAEVAKFAQEDLEGSLSIEIPIQFNQNSKIWISGVIGPFFNTQKKQFIGIFHDITSHKLRLEELELAKAKSFQAAKLATLGKMLGEVSHELKTPIMVLESYANKLIKLRESKEGADLGPVLDRAKDFGEKINVMLARCMVIIETARKSTRDEGHEEALEHGLGDILSATEELLMFVTKYTDFKMVDPPNEVRLVVKKVQMTQVLINLIKNGVDAIKDLETKWVRLEFQVLNEAEKKWLKILVIDSGGGIPPQYRDKILKPFFTSKSAEEGTGLGLSLSRDIIQQFGGELSIDFNHPNTCFVIQLPIAN